MSSSKNISKSILFWIAVFSLSGLALLAFSMFYFEEEAEPLLTEKPSRSFKKDSLEKEKIRTASFVNSITVANDSCPKVIKVSEKKYLNIHFGLDYDAGRGYKRIYNGRRINIAITGVDSRLGSRYKHADANHILSVLIDQGRIEMLSVPRDTPSHIVSNYTASDDSTTYYKLTDLRAVKGRKQYFVELARIAGLDRIHHYIEFGFSQAMGLLEFFGFKDSGSALQVLRSRGALGGNDYQRVYTQAQFIRQMIYTNFGKMTGFWQDILIGSGLAMVETDLSTKRCKYILSKLKSNGFPEEAEDISVYIMPPINLKYKVYNFTDSLVMEELRKKVESYAVQKTKDSLSHRCDVYSLLTEKIINARNYLPDRPVYAINTLNILFSQRAWLQIHGIEKRRYIRGQFSEILQEAYILKGNNKKAEDIKAAIKAEIQLLENSRDYSMTEMNKDSTKIENQ